SRISLAHCGYERRQSGSWTRTHPGPRSGHSHGNRVGTRPADSPVADGELANCRPWRHSRIWDCAYRDTTVRDAESAGIASAEYDSPGPASTCGDIRCDDSNHHRVWALAGTPYRECVPVWRAALRR